MPMMQEQGVDMVAAFLRFQGEQGLADLRSLVERTAKQMAAVLTDVSEEQARLQPDPDVWPIARTVMHAIDFADRGYRTAARLARGGTLEEEPARLSPPDPPDRSLADWERLELLMHGEDDANPPPPEAQGLSLAQLRQRLSEAWEQALRAIDEMPAEPDLASTQHHPFFGELNCKEWLVLLHVHGTVHIRQIQEAKALMGLAPPGED